MKTNLVIDALFHTTEELPLCKSFFPCGVRESINLVFRTADEKVFQKSLGALRVNAAQEELTVPWENGCIFIQF